MHRLSRCLVALGLLLAFAAPAQAALPQTLRVCGDVNEFPPLSYHQRVDGKKSRTVAGFDVEVLEYIFAGSGHKLDVDLVPWARCLLMAKRGQFDIVMDGIKTPERERDFLHASSHYALTPILFYLKGEPKPVLDTVQDLAQQRICSQADYNYASYGVPDAMITNRARSIDDAAAMLKLGRCSILLQEVEVLQAHARLGGIDLMNHPDFEKIKADWMKPIDFYFMVARTNPHRKELLDVLDRGIARMRRNGELERVRNLHHSP
jgi:polar amino acid transport system substrate-binding protein